MRLFVAVDAGSVAGAAPAHITLAFLGEVAPERCASIVAALKTAAETAPPFDLELNGVGAFPSAERPRVVWIGATEGRAAVEVLAETVREALASVGFPQDRKRFHPHVTLFRVRSPADRRRARDLLEGALAPPPSHRVRVAEFVLKESELSARGATHRTLAAFPLRGASGPSVDPAADVAGSTTSGRER